MTPIQTDREAVERLCERMLDDCNSPDAARYQPYTDGRMRDTVATLRALLSERDAAEARAAAAEGKVDTYRAVEADLLAENDALKFQLKNALAAVEAVRREERRIRRGWLATIQAENSCPATGGGCLSKRCGCIEEMEMLMREDDARGAAQGGGE